MFTFEPNGIRIIFFDDLLGSERRFMPDFAATYLSSVSAALIERGEITNNETRQVNINILLIKAIFSS